MGRSLWSLARAHQVLCVTHLPQLAAYADAHYRIAYLGKFTGLDDGERRAHIDAAVRAADRVPAKERHVH